MEVAVATAPVALTAAAAATGMCKKTEREQVGSESTGACGAAGLWCGVAASTLPKEKQRAKAVTVVEVTAATPMAKAVTAVKPTAVKVALP